MGWYYATLHSDKLRHLILLNALYGADAPQPVMGHGSEMEDPADPGHLSAAVGAYGCNAADSLLRGWDQSISEENKAAWVGLSGVATVFGLLVLWAGPVPLLVCAIAGCHAKVRKSTDALTRSFFAERVIGSPLLARRWNFERQP